MTGDTTPTWLDGVAALLDGELVDGVGWVPNRLRTTTDAGRISAPAEGDTMASGTELNTHLVHTLKREGELTLFDERSQNDFYGNAHLVEEWAGADMDTFSDAAHHLTIGNLKEGIAVAEAVEREMMTRARHAKALAENLRRVASQAAIHGQPQEAEVSYADPLR